MKGEGNSLDFDARILDPRLGRWLSRDPQYAKYPSTSPYAAFGNNPIYFVDPSGETLRVAGKDEEVLLQKFRKTADKKWQAILKKLDESEVIYNIELSANNQPGGSTQWTSMSSMDGQEQELTMYIAVPPDETDDTYAVNILGDELMHSYQFDVGDIGFESVLDDKGVG